MKWFSPALLLSILMLSGCGGGTTTVQGDILNWPNNITGRISVVSKQDATVVFGAQDGFRSDSKFASGFTSLTTPTDAQLTTLGFNCGAGYTQTSTLTPANFSGTYGLGRYSHPKSPTDQTIVQGNLGLFSNSPKEKEKTGDQQAVWVYVKADVTLEGEVKCKSPDAKVHDLTWLFSFTVNNQIQKTTLKAGWNLLINTVDKLVDTEKEVIYKYRAVQALPSTIRWFYLEQ